MNNYYLTMIETNQTNVFKSFRDPLGKVVMNTSDVWRIVSTRSSNSLKEFLKLRLVEEWQQKKRIIETQALGNDDLVSFEKDFGDAGPFDSDYCLFKHRRIDFPSFPYEWPPEMLYEAGKFTLEISDHFFEMTGWCLKDASPFNVLFEGTRPVFIDMLSFEKRKERDPLWLPYNQFTQSFLLPLLLNREIGLSLRTIFMSNRDGLRVSEAWKFLRGVTKLKPHVFNLVTLPNFLSKRAVHNSQLYQEKEANSEEKARFIIHQSFRRLRRQLERVKSDGSQHGSEWSGYTKLNQENIPEYMRAKQTFLERTLDEFRPKRVLDIGCNNGFFSFIAARSGASVVAIDYDETVIGQVYRSAGSEGLNVLPLVVNLSRPTPRLGWRYAENPSFLDRAVGHFDLVMMLAVIHHMLVSERIPLREIFRLAADLTTTGLIAEFVPPNDKMFKCLTRGRDQLHLDLTVEKFTETAAEFFHLVRREKLPQTERQLYLLKKK